MPVLLLLLAVGVLLHAWWSRRGSALTRACRWRLDRRLGPQIYRCASCGAVTTTGAGNAPRQCRKDSVPRA